jgi:hypothetical protein
VEQQSVQRYLDNQFYEHVNSPKWRDRLRASLGFCHEHAWLAVSDRLGDALGFTIIYHDIINHLLNQVNLEGEPVRRSIARTSFLRQIPERARTLIEKTLIASKPRKPCPACEHRDEIISTILSALTDELETPEMTDALRLSAGLCLPHLRLTLQQIKDASIAEKLLTIQRGKLESLRSELAEFIRKNDYQRIEQGFGKEGDAWLRAMSMIVGHRKGK